MNKLYTVKISSPNGDTIYNDIQSIYLTSERGPLGILPGYTPIIGLLKKKGTVRLIRVHGEDTVLNYTGGDAFVLKDNVLTIFLDIMDNE